MSQAWSYIVAHQTVFAVVAYWIGSNFISALPSPSQTSNGFYKFFFTLMHGLAGSIPRVIPGLRLPSDPTKDSQTFFGNGK